MSESENECTMRYKKIKVTYINSSEDINKNIKIHHECEGEIEKSVPRITDWYNTRHADWWQNGEREGRIFLSNPHTNNEFYFMLTT